ncbi:MAG: response regulator [Gammaproteobacteria bacterium]|jgi:CheY-like chemotaxis protein
MTQPSEKILCVDDQPEIIDLLNRHLHDSYDCHFAGSGAEALSAIDTAGPFAVVIVDYSMPNMDGITLLGEIRKRSPDTVPLMLTAYGDIDVAIAALHQGNIFRFLRKPWESDELKRAISDTLDHYHLIANERRLKSELAAANAELDARLKELDETNRLLEYWVEFSPAVLYCLSIDSGKAHPSYVSKNFSRLTGHERTAFVIDPDFWGEHVHPDDRSNYLAMLAQLIDGDVVEQTLEYRILHATGESRRILDAMRVIRNHEGIPLEVVGAWLDTSSRPA